MNNLNRALSEYPVTVSIDIPWSDLDALGMVNNVLFYRYFEKARFEYYARLGMAPGSQVGDIGPVMAFSSCRYFASLTYPDTITVGARVREIKTTSFVMEFAIESGKAGRAALGETVIVMVDYGTGEKVPLLEEVREAIRKIEGRV
jgi:acyl-CoA thioester hydrolase